MVGCPRARRRLTRYGWCHYYNFQKSEHMVSVRSHIRNSIRLLWKEKYDFRLLVHSRALFSTQVVERLSLFLTAPLTNLKKLRLIWLFRFFASSRILKNISIAYNKTDATTGALQFVDGMTLFYSQYSDQDNDVMLLSQSTTALPGRLTQGRVYK